MQVAVSKSSQNISPPIAGTARLGINAKSAATFSRQISEKPRLAWVSGQSAATQNEKIISQDAKKQDRARRFRHYLAMRQREAIYEAGLAGEFKTLCACGAFAVPAFGKSKKTGDIYFTGSPGVVQLTWQAGKDGESRLVHSWVKRCASPLLCFVDAPKIRWYRSQEVQTICKKLYEAGYCWLFWTFTAPHDLSSDPDEQVGLFQEAMRIFKEHFDRFKEKWGLRFSIRAVEMTDDAPGPGRKSGCHFHHHVVCFFEREDFTDEEAKRLQAYLSKRWVAALVKVGLCPAGKEKAALRWAFRLDVPRRPQKISDMDLQAVAEYLGKGASMEMTPGINTKQGRGSGHGKRISHWDVMRLAFTSNPELKLRALAIMRALKGRAWLAYSRGLYDFCGLREVEDKDILKEKLGYMVHSYSNRQWYKMDRVKGQAALDDAVTESIEAEGIDLSDPPISEENKDFLDLDDPVVKKIQEIADFSITVIIETGCDPLTGEDLRVDPRPLLPLADP